MSPLTKITVLFFSCLALGSAAFPNTSPVVLTNDGERYFITPFLQYYCDTTRNLSIEEISAPAFTGKFSKVGIPYIEKNYDKNYWVRFTIINKRDRENLSWYFESWGFDLDEVEFYVPDKRGGFFKTSMGYNRNFYDRNIIHKNFQFHIHLNQNEEATYYVKLKRRYPMHLTFFVRSHEDFIEHVVNEYWYLGIFYGIFAFIILLNVFLFIRLKEKIYLYYVLCAFSEVLYCLGRDGLGFQFLWPSFPELNYITHHNITQFLLIFFTLLYANQFLKLRKEQRFMYRLSIAAIIIKTLLFCYFFIEPIAPIYIFTIDSFILCIPFASGIIALSRGNKFARYYVIAFSCLFLSFLMIFLEERQMLPFMVVNWYWINIGMLLEVIFLAISLIDQIRILRQENDQAQQRIIGQLKENEKLKDKMNLELEEKVSERTEKVNQMVKTLELKNQELSQANRELEALNERVREMNELLNKDNEQLKTDITQISKSRILLKDVKFEEFQRVFPDEQACFRYLSELKWKNGFQCKKCGYQKAGNSKTPYGMRCKGCNYDESPTTDTLFHKLKFPITKAFYMAYLVSAKDKKVTLEELSAMLSLRRETCWSFRKKILQAKEQVSKRGIKEEDGWESVALIAVSN
ncbi:MAG: transposase [Cytophagaceae bacterium]|nr:transposase [Cytophagaceae bacterium]